MAERFEFMLDVVEALVIGRAVGGDVARYPLRSTTLPSDPVRFVRVAKQVHLALEARRLSESGDLHPAVRKAFGLLREHRVSVAVGGVDGLGADVAVLAVTDGAQALAITQLAEGDELLFSLFADEDLVDVITGVLPPAAAATTGAPGAPVLEKVLAAPRLGGGHLMATGRGRLGERVAGNPVSWLDTADGRYLIHTTTGPSGELSADYVPAGRAELARAVQGVIAAVC